MHISLAVGQHPTTKAHAGLSFPSEEPHPSAFARRGNVLHFARVLECFGVL